MSVKSSGSTGDPSGGEVVRVGYLKKLKTMRKKFFVLRAETLESSARLEYYDSEKKYRAQQPPKRSISLKACFNINKRVDTKHKHVIALYTKDDCFCVVLESERDLDEWLKALLSLQHGEDVVDGEPPKPTFEHVWQVTMLNKGLGSTRNILGAYHLCFTDKKLSLVRKATGTNCGSSDYVEFSLTSIRRCGNSECFFYMEVGRSAVTGAGELWMQTEDTNIAQNMGEVILRAMSNNNKEDFGPKPRIRSSSANEASKPILVQRRQTHTGQKSNVYCSPSQDGVSKSGEVPVTVPEASSTSVAAGYSNVSTPCPATPHIASVTAVTGSGSGFMSVQPLFYQRPSQRRHSVSGGAAPWSGTAHHQRTQSLPLAPHVCSGSATTADNNNTVSVMSASPSPYVPSALATPTLLASVAVSTSAHLPHLPPTRTVKRSNTNAVTNVITSTVSRMGGRERCDSMPSRARTTSEGTPPVAVVHPMRSHLVPHRPQSFYGHGREISHSPPAGSPISPGSAACSTDSAGSSLSIDEPDAWPDYAETPLSRYSHSLTPDEPIVEENCDEGMENSYVPISPTSGSPIIGGYVPMAPLSSDDGYVDMSPRGRHNDMSPAASTCSITSGTPSTDMRFSEYHLEKVSSYFTPSEEDDTSSAERPLRAYSVGSRSDVLKLRPKMDGNGDNSRVRAFSVGSRSKGIHSRVLPPHGHPPTTGCKSSSAPLLSGSNSHLGSQSSMERMDDLMEIDFSKPDHNKSTGYVDMSPRNRSTPAGYVEMKPGVSAEPLTPDLPYVDMKPMPSPMRPASTASQVDSSKDQHPYLDMRPAPATSPLKPSSVPLGSLVSSGTSSSSRDSAYLDMRPSTSPHKPSSIPKYNSYYVEMSGNKLGSSPKSNAKTASPIQEEYMDMDFKRSVPRTDRTISGAARTQPVDLPYPKKTADGYMEMSWNRHHRKSSLDSAKISTNNNDDYMYMSARKKERRGSRKEKNRSQPINIQTSTSSTKPITSQSPVSSFTSFLQTRKNSSETPSKHPPNYLPLSSSCSPGSSPFSSLRRPRSRKNSRRDSRDSSGLVTPTSETSTIFPFSPGSPIKPFNTKTPDFTSSSKCPVDASSGTVNILNSGKPPHSGDYYKISHTFNNKMSTDYTEMNFETQNHLDTSKSMDLDYVNYCPGAPKQRNISGSSDDYGEYAIMRPVSIVQNPMANVRKISAPALGTQNTITKQLSSLSMNNIKPCVFKPIVEPKEDNRLGTTSPKPGDEAPHRSFENLRDDKDTTSQSEAAESNYETLRGGNCISPVTKNGDKFSKNSRPGSVSSEKSLSRPSSVSSEVIKGSLSRPSSVSSELGSSSSTIVGGSRPGSVNAEIIARPSSVSSERELHYASLDLAPAEDDGTKSPRNSRGQDAARSPTPSAITSEPGFTYAEIDFIRSEGMKNLVNAKVKH